MQEKSRRRRTALWLVTTALALGILVLSLIPKPPELDVGVSFGDKIAHIAAYLVLGYMLTRSSLTSLPRSAKLRLGMMLGSLAICIAYGGLIELLQHFTGRQTELWDLAADTVGALGGVVLARFVPGAMRRLPPTTIR
jgi:VanZ family protein